MKYTIESRVDRLVVIRSTHGAAIVCGSQCDAYQFRDLKQANLIFSALQYRHNLHSGFKIHEVKPCSN